MTARAQGALAGIVVADFSRVLAAPYATMLHTDELRAWLRDRPFKPGVVTASPSVRPHGSPS